MRLGLFKIRTFQDRANLYLDTAPCVDIMHQNAFYVKYCLLRDLNSARVKATAVHRHPTGVASILAGGPYI